MKDPWQAERARLGSAWAMLRIIDLIAERQEFKLLLPRRHPTPDELNRLFMLDGCTLIHGVPPKISAELRAAILEKYDALYWRATCEPDTPPRIAAAAA